MVAIGDLMFVYSGSGVETFLPHELLMNFI